MYVSLSKLSIVDPSKLTKGQANDSQPLSCSLATLLIFFHSSPFMLLSFINSRGYVILYSPIILPFTRGLLNLFGFIYLVTIAYFINTPGLILASQVSDSFFSSPLEKIESDTWLVKMTWTMV